MRPKPQGDALYGLAYDLLSAATTLLGADAPAVRYIAMPLPALDCPEQLTVHSDSLLKEFVADGDGPLLNFKSVMAASQNSYGLILSCTRCVTVPEKAGETPTAQWSAEAQRTLTDLCVLFYGVQDMIRAGTLWSDYADAVSVGPATPIFDQGGTGGWALTYRIEL